MEADTKMIVHCAVVYHGPESDRSELCRLTLADCEYDLAEIRLCKDCYLMSNSRSDKDWFLYACVSQILLFCFCYLEVNMVFVCSFHILLLRLKPWPGVAAAWLDLHQRFIKMCTVWWWFWVVKPRRNYILSSAPLRSLQLPHDLGRAAAG